MKYEYRTSVTIDGKRYYFRAHNKKDLEANIEQKREEIKQHRKIKRTEITVTKWSETVLDTYKSNVTDATLTGYRSKIRRHIVPVIGSERVIDVTPIQCQDVINRMSGCAADTIKKVRELLYLIFDKAVQNRYIANNPADHLTLPKGGRTKRRSITETERRAILNVAENDLSRYVYFLFMLFCGCRPSEAARIKGADIIYVDKQPVLHIRGTKTANADRYVPVPKYLSSRLPEVDPQSLMCTTQRGCKLTSINRQHLWLAFRRDLNIYLGCRVYRNQLIPPYPVAPDLTPYCLRHTYCTDLMRAGVDVRIAQHLMGHASIQITADIYTHVDSSEITDTAPALNDYVNRILSENEPDPGKNGLWDGLQNRNPLKNGDSTWPSHGQIMGSIPVGGTKTK